jgi:predicted nucleotidyltransferase
LVLGGVFVEAEYTIKKIANMLRGVEGIEAVVVGGSRVKGNYTEKSDIDIGIYYNNEHILDLDALNREVAELDDSYRSNLVTRIGEWGPWINGGGWLQVDGIATDFLLRDLNRVSEVIEACLNGKITIDYQPGHPHGFINAIYLAETHYCKELWVNTDLLSYLKNKITPYPLSVKTGIINKFL